MINFVALALISALFSTVPSVLAQTQPESRIVRIVRAELLKEQAPKVLDISRIAVEGIEGDSQYKLPSARNGVAYYKLIYRTKDTQGRPVQASGLVIVPQTPVLRGVLSFQHATTTNRSEVPSRGYLDQHVIACALAYGSQGYLVTLADYLGLGESPGFHPFLHAASEASASRDLLSAAREFVLNRRGAEWNGNLFLAGYSQGGHATLALQRDLEAHPIEGFRLVAVAPMSGPYDLSGVTLEEYKKRPTEERVFFAVYFAASLGEITAGEYVGEEFLKPKNRKIVRDYFSGVIKEIPPSPLELFEKGPALAALANPNHRVWSILAENNVYDFKPVAPIRFLHSRGDQLIPFENAEVASRRMNELGGVTEVINLGDQYTHRKDFGVAVVASLKWFEEIQASLK